MTNLKRKISVKIFKQNYGVLICKYDLQMHKQKSLYEERRQQQEKKSSEGAEQNKIFYDVYFFIDAYTRRIVRVYRNVINNYIALF